MVLFFYYCVFFSRPADARDADQPAQWNADIDVLEVILLAALELEAVLLRIDGPADFGGGDLIFAGEIFERRRIWILEFGFWIEQVGDFAGDDDVSTMRAGAGADVDEIIAV